MKTTVSQRQQWGAKIKARQNRLHLKDVELANHAGITTHKLNLIEHGRFLPEDSDVQAILKALGYPRTTLETLDKDKPCMPEWVAQRNYVKQSASAEESEEKQKIGEALQKLRLGQRIPQSKLSKRVGYTQIVGNIERGGSYSEEALKETLARFHLKNTDQLLAYVEKHGLEVPDMSQFKGKLKLLYTACRILRTHWQITAEPLEKYAAPGYTSTKQSIIQLEEQIRPESTPFLETIMGLITALYNVSQIQEHKVFSRCPNVQRIAVIANEEKTFSYNRQFKQSFERAIDEIVNKALDIEQHGLELPNKKKRGRIGFYHPNNVVSPLSEQMDKER